MPELPAEAVQAATDALTKVRCEHTLGWSCAECRARAALEAAAPFLAGVGSPASCPSAAPESTQSPETTSVAPVYHLGVERPAEALSALRQRYADAMWKAAEYVIVAELICCDPINPAHDLCVTGDAVRKLAHQLIYDTPDVASSAELTDAVLAVRDDELARALRIADYHADQHRQAEAAIARSRASLAEFDARPWHDVPTPGSVLEAWRTSLAVSEEQTGHACGNCEGIDPASCINAPRPPASSARPPTRPCRTPSPARSPAATPTRDGRKSWNAAPGSTDRSSPCTQRPRGLPAMRDETSQRIDAMTGEERVLVLEYFAGSDPEGFAEAAAEARARARGDAPQQADVSPGRSDATCDGTDTRTRQ